VILGARSSLFLPFSRLGLVIVDEEHDASYKQTDPAPRYNARDAAIVLASMHGAKTLLGSATPAIDTYFKATSGKYGLVTLSRRFNNQPLPPIKIIDLTAARKKKEMTGPLTISTIQAVNQTLDNNKQAIFFRNRRGFAPIARCKQCAWIPKCHNCDVTLTYHQSSHKLVCHYCGATYPLPNLCPQCRQPSVEVIGYGTERVEEELLNLFPSRKIIRMDLDTTRNKGNYQSLIEQFSAGKADILIGTQMVTKGLDFKNVKTVTVVNADELITFPDFKSSERGFNMLEQVAGRAGRGDSDGASVLVQTYQPDHPIYPFVVNHDYKGFYDYEIQERQRFNYPPFTRIIYVYLKHRDRGALQTFSQAYAGHLRQLLGNRVQGPDEPKVSRIKSLYIQRIMIK
ncbi:MAG: primosomal protein N', partial [Muribaculaceae bacterium]|nr:primosomal protein N' [Muribaculaceae bacterium]